MVLEIEKTLLKLRAVKQSAGNTAALEARLTRQLRQLFGRAFDDMVALLVSSGRVPAGTFNQQQLMRALIELEPRVAQYITDAGVQAAGLGRSLVGREVAINTGTRVSLTAFNPVIVERLKQTALANAGEKLLERVVGNIGQILADSYKAGLGIDETVKLLRDAFTNVRDYELVRVARTETIRAQNWARHKTIEELCEYEQWWSAEDERVRDSHVEVHAQIARVGDRFSNGLLYPGDSDGTPIEEWINCRCRPVPFNMPFGYMAPPGRQWFYEHEIVRIAPENEPPPERSEDEVA